MGLWHHSRFYCASRKSEVTLTPQLCGWRSHGYCNVIWHHVICILQHPVIRMKVEGGGGYPASPLPHVSTSSHSPGNLQDQRHVPGRRGEMRGDYGGQALTKCFSNSALNPQGGRTVIVDICLSVRSSVLLRASDKGGYGVIFWLCLQLLPKKMKCQPPLITL